LNDRRGDRGFPTEWGVGRLDREDVDAALTKIVDKRSAERQPANVMTQPD
jgi:hypothetical protein